MGVVSTPGSLRKLLRFVRVIVAENCGNTRARLTEPDNVEIDILHQ